MSDLTDEELREFLRRAENLLRAYKFQTIYVVNCPHSPFPKGDPDRFGQITIRREIIKDTDDFLDKLTLRREAIQEIER